LVVVVPVALAVFATPVVLEAAVAAVVATVLVDVPDTACLACVMVDGVTFDVVAPTLAVAVLVNPLVALLSAVRAVPVIPLTTPFTGFIIVLVFNVPLLLKIFVPSVLFKAAVPVFMAVLTATFVTAR
jgi:hypothetical protein